MSASFVSRHGVSPHAEVYIYREGDVKVVLRSTDPPHPPLKFLRLLPIRGMKLEETEQNED
jgi:hypothetical protein